MFHLPTEWRAARRVVVAASALFVLIVCRWQPWTLLDRAGFSNDFYDAQARAFWHLRLDVPAEVAGPEGFLIGGRTYLYYGPLLAILRMPFALVGHWFDGRLVRLSMTAAYSVSCIAALRLLASVARRTAATVSPRRAALFAALVAAGPILSMAGWESVYHETELWAFALFLLALAATLDLVDQPTTRSATLCGVLVTATVLTRASVGYGAVVAMTFAAATVWRRKQRAARVAMAWPACALASSLSLNLAKFGTLLDLPADRQVLTLQSTARAAWFAGNDGSFFSARFLPTTVVQYLRPDAIRLERLVPFVRFGPLATEYGSYPLEGNTPSTSLTVAATALLVLAVVGITVAVRDRLGWMAPLVAATAVAAAPTLLIGFVAQRYLIDLLPAVLVPAALAVACLPVVPDGWRRVSRVALAGSLAWSSVVNLALATWISELKNPRFTEVRYAIDEALFDGRPPSVVRVDRSTPVPRDGVVGIDGGCAGLYIAEQGSWVALERADGVRSLAAVLRGDGSGLTVSAPDGELTVRATADGIEARWRPTGDDASEGTVSSLTAPIAVSVVSDPLVGGLRVYADGVLVLAAAAAPDLTFAVLQGDAERLAAGNTTDVCGRLERRLAGS